jgi:Tfp pilus assembly protein PilE
MRAVSIRQEPAERPAPPDGSRIETEIGMATGQDSFWCTRRARGGGTMKTERGFSIIECLVYIAVLAVVLDLSFVAYYHYDQHTRNLRRNADDIVRTMHAGERWREDVRAAIAPPHVIENGLVIPQQSGEVTYVFADDAVWRQTGATRVPVLKQVKASTMAADSRQHVNAWRWELELASPQKIVLVHPLFTFTTVVRRSS